MLAEIGIEAAGESSTQHDLVKSHLLNSLGVARSGLFQFDAATAALSLSLTIRARELGDDHLETTGTQQNLASLVADRGDYAGSLKLYRAAEASLAVSGARFTAQQRRLALCRYAANYGRCLTELGKHGEAHVALARSVELLDSGPDNHVYRRAIEYCFGNLNMAEGRQAEAAVRYSVCLNHFGLSIQEKSPLLTCGCHYKLAGIALQEDRPMDAL